MIVFLDSNILGKIAKPDRGFETAVDESSRCKRLVDRLLSRGHRVVTSDICDYEVRRGLLSDRKRTGNMPLGIIELDRLIEDGLIEFLPVSREVLTLAADLWANADTEGRTTRDKKNIDVDIIISAQCQILQADNLGQQVIIATTNVKHLSRFCEAVNWQEIEC
jgi:hypothetical protein